MRISDWSSDVCSSDLLCDCPYRTERTVSGWRIDQLQAVPSPDLLLERRERDFGFDRVLWTPAAGQRRPIGLTDPCLAVEGAGVEVLIEIGAGEAEALHLVAHRDEAVVQIGRASCRERGCQHV